MPISMYFIGTGHDKNETSTSHGAKAQLFPCIYDFDGGIPEQTKFIFDGPGSKLMSRHGRDGGTAFGDGWRANIDRGIKALQRHATGANTRVSLVGHSRGAVTCHMMAHAIKRKFPNYRVFIFAIDPVPGGETDFTVWNPFSYLSGASASSIPDNVYDYTSILMQNDSNPMFGVLGPKRLSTHCRHQYLSMPGKHGDCVKIPTENYPASLISAGLLIPWLTSQGINIGWQVPDDCLVECYALVHEQATENGYLQASKGAFRGVKGIAKAVGAGVLGPTLGVAAAGLQTALGTATAGQIPHLNPTVGLRAIGTGLAAPFLLPTSSYWQNNRAADVPNSQRGHRLYLNRHHESLLKLNPAFRAWAAQPWLPRTVNRLRATLPRTYNVLQRLGMIDQGLSEDNGQIWALAAALQSF